MTTNVSVEYSKAQSRYEEAKSNEEKLIALQEMHSTAPSHKGAEKMRAEITRKIALLKRDIEKSKEQQKKTAGGASVGVKKEGIGQIVLVGMPNTGKSSLLKALTGVDVEIAPYPFTTKNPEVGMLNFNGAKIQLVEVPAIIEGSAEGKANGIQLLSIIRNSDAIVFVLNAANAQYEFDVLKKEFSKANILLNRSKPKIEIKSSPFKGITIARKDLLKVKEETFIEFLKNMGLHNVSVILGEETDLEKTSEALNEKLVYKKCIIVLNEFFGKTDEKQKELLKKEAPLKEILLLNDTLKLFFEGDLFNLLGKILIYTKKPGESAEKSEPLVLEKSSTTEDVAKVLHKDFAAKLKYAKVWGSTKFPGQMVAKDYELQNEDIVEIYC